jgi:hypothetical protein
MGKVVARMSARDPCFMRQQDLPSQPLVLRPRHAKSPRFVTESIHVHHGSHWLALDPCGMAGDNWLEGIYYVTSCLMLLDSRASGLRASLKHNRREKGPLCSRSAPEKA